jgi:hypothetical protein
MIRQTVQNLHHFFESKMGAGVHLGVICVTSCDTPRHLLSNRQNRMSLSVTVHPQITEFIILRDTQTHVEYLLALVLKS